MKVIQLFKNESQLIKRAAQNNREAQQKLYEIHSGKMLSVCRQYIKDMHHAEEVMLNGFLKVFTHLKDFESKGSFEGWIRRIMVNQALTHIRKNKSMYLEVEIEKAEREPDYNQLQNKLEVEDLQKLIDRLPTGYKTVFNLYAIEGYSHREIAEQRKLGMADMISEYHKV